MKLSELPYPDRFPHLVVGGRFSMDSGSVSWDMASDLQSAPPWDVLQAAEEIDNAETLEDVRNTLEWLCANNLNFVGSKDRVFSSHSMLGYVKAVIGGEPVWHTLFTRTLGLREKVIGFSY